MIKLYSTPTCQYCKKLKTFLDSKDVKYLEIDVSTDAVAKEEMMKISGQMSVPVTSIRENGKFEVIVGSDEETFKKILNI